MNIFKSSDIWFFGGVLLVIVALKLASWWCGRKKPDVPYNKGIDEVVADAEFLEYNPLQDEEDFWHHFK